MKTSNYKVKFPVRSVLIIMILIILFQWLIPSNNTLLLFFIDYIFTPLQRLKTSFFNLFPFSIGDLLYSCIIIYIIYLMIRWIGSLITIRKSKQTFLIITYRLVIVGLVILLSFSFTWNTNYNRPRIHEQFTSWKDVNMNDSLEKSLNCYILKSINSFDTNAFVIRSRKEWNEMIEQSYRNTYKATPSLYCKASLFGRLIQTMGVQGYYNPLTSEAQINANIPECLIPFVIAHELAHVMGVASEGDANFVAYQICSKSEDAYIRYSALLNLYLYNIRSLKYTDSIFVIEVQKKLPTFLVDDLATIKKYNESKPFNLNKWTLPFYNWFLKINGDEQGIRSYSSLTKYVYIQEILEQKEANIPIRPYPLMN